MTVSGQLRERMTFALRTAGADDGYGNFEAAWADQFTAAARIMPLKGGEDVMANRLAGTQPVIITVRSSSDSRLIAPNWKATDARAGTVYNIRSIANMDEKNGYLDLLATAGVPV